MPIKVKDLRKGDIVYESAYGATVELVVLEDPVFDGRGWSCRTDKTALYVAEGFDHYGPQLYYESSTYVNNTLLNE